MKLLSQKSREYKGKEYRKFWVVVPNKIVDKLDWKAGEELNEEVIEDRLLIRKKPL